MDKLDFGKELIKIRKVRGLTQTEVAEKCNVTMRTIQRIESGAVTPRSSTIKIISESLEIDFFLISNQNSNLKSHTILWYLKDLFNFKTNAMKKISILSTSILILAFIAINVFRTEAQSKSSEKEQETVLKSQDKKVDFAKEFDEFKIDEKVVFVTKNNKHGLYYLNGKTIIPCIYDRIEVYRDFVTVKKSNKFGLMNLDGKVIIPCEYDTFKAHDNFITVKKSNKFGLMNLDGKVIIPCEYDTFKAHDNFITVRKKNKIGLMNLDGKIIIPCEYDTMKIEGTFAIVSKNGNPKRIEI